MKMIYDMQRSVDDSVAVDSRENMEKGQGGEEVEEEG
jgi:hypothetical protein